MKVAVIGCGAIAGVHAEALCSQPETELAAFVDINIEKAEKLKKECGLTNASVYDSMEDLLERETIHAVHICTPHYLHVPMALTALAKGIHVFMEKPPAMSREEFRTLKEAERKSEGTLGVCFQNRYNDNVKKVKQMLLSGECGSILGARAFVTWSRSEDYYTKSGWRGKKETEGGGVLINQAIHTLDLLVYFMGPVHSCEASMSNHHLKDVIDVEDTVEAMIHFQSGQALFYATTAYQSNSPVMIELSCENVTIRIEGTEVICYYSDGRKENIDCESGRKAGKDYWGSSHADCICDFYASIREGRGFLNDIRGIEDSFLLMSDIYRSAEVNAVVGYAPLGGVG